MSIDADVIVVGAGSAGAATPDGRAGARLNTSQGDLRGRFVVDASGLRGAGLVERPAVAPEYICTAAQEMRVVRDLQEAHRFLATHRARPEEMVSFTGVAGGFSVLFVRVSDRGHGDIQGPHMNLLTGTVPARGNPAAVVLRDRFLATHPWVGERLYGGARAIPLCPPHDRLGEGPVALLGDAAGQVFSIHGSGVGHHLVAAEILGEVLGGGGTPWDYSVRWHRRWGGTLAAAAEFARFSTTMSPTDNEEVVKYGLMTVGLARQGLEQQRLDLALVELPRLLAGAVRTSRLALRMLPVVARMNWLRLHHRRYPARPEDLPRWTAAR